jgi:uncharacterized protein (TIGR03435 family)
MLSQRLACLGLGVQFLFTPWLFSQGNAAAGSQQTPPPAAASPALAINLDVVSVKPSGKNEPGANIFSPPKGDYIAVTDMSPHMILGLAFDFPLHDEIYGLPGWTDQEAYDVTAKVSGKDLPAFQELRPFERNPLLQKVMQSRFHLKYHYDTKVLPAYALVVGKGGPHMPESKDAAAVASKGSMHTRHGEIIGQAVSMGDFAHVLSQQIGRPIADQTNLKGGYDLKLDWTPEMGQNSTATPTSDTGPSIYTALQEQLGLKLEAAKVPVRVLVVDGIDRPEQN